jgi:predicted transcriptional regulator
MPSLELKPRQRRIGRRSSSITVRLDTDLVNAIDQFAQESGSTRSAVITALLERQQKFLRAKGGAA